MCRGEKPCENMPNQHLFLLQSHAGWGMCRHPSPSPGVSQVHPIPCGTLFAGRAGWNHCNQPHGGCSMCRESKYMPPEASRATSSQEGTLSAGRAGWGPMQPCTPQHAPAPGAAWRFCQQGPGAIVGCRCAHAAGRAHGGGKSCWPRGAHRGQQGALKVGLTAAALPVRQACRGGAVREGAQVLSKAGVQHACELRVYSGSCKRALAVRSFWQVLEAHNHADQQQS